jgi:hypothetical protein
LGAVGGAGLCFALQSTSTLTRQDAGGLLGAEVDVKRLPYIDAHSHVWSPDVARWPLVNGQTREDLKPLSFTPEELFKLAEPEGVGRVVLIQHTG